MSLDVDSTTVAGQWFRQVPAGADPVRRPEPPADNRWQRGDVSDALYLADGELCVWAEWYRHLAEAAMPPHAALPRDLWTYDVAPVEVADLSNSDRLAQVGLTLPRPGRRSWSPFQEVGERLNREQWRGFVAPSAARPANAILVIFLAEGLLPQDITPTGRSRFSEAPAPPSGMLT